MQVALAAPSYAATSVPAIAVGDDGFTNDGDGPWTLGWRFTADAGTEVTALGVFDADGDGLASSHLVGLWDDLNTLIASVTVSAGDLLIDGFRYADISSVVLSAGVTYTVAAADLGGGDPYYLESTISTPSFISFQTAAFREGTGLGFPGDDTPVNGYFGANLLVSQGTSIVPEPATWALLIGGFAIAGSALRRRGHSAGA
jgi:hypothetical protein